MALQENSTALIYPNSHRRSTTLRAIAVLYLALAFSGGGVFAGETNGRGAKTVALGNAFVAVADNAWSATTNPAGLAHLSNVEGAVFVVPEQFGLPELSRTAAALALPTRIGGLGVVLEQFGFELYRESNAALAVGRNFDRGIAAGAALNLQHISIERYGTTQLATLDVGLLAQLLDAVTLGFAMKNIGGTTIGPFKERLPQLFLLGAAYRPDGSLLVTAEVEKDPRYALVAKSGVEYTLAGYISVRAGVSSNPDRFSLGLGARYSPFEFSYAGYSHVHLGWTHHVELSVRFGN